MDISEAIDSYQNMIGLLNVDSLTVRKVSWAFKMLGLPLDEIGAELVTDMIKSAGTKLDTTSVLDVIKDPDIIKELNTALPKVLAMKQLEDKSSGTSNGSNDSIHIDSLITCGHCGGRVHVRSAIESATA